MEQQPQKQHDGDPVSSTAADSNGKMPSGEADTPAQPASVTQRPSKPVAFDSPNLSGTSIGSSSSPAIGRPSFSTDGESSAFSSFVDVSESRGVTPSTSAPSLGEDLRNIGSSSARNATYDEQDREHGPADTSEGEAEEIALEHREAATQAEEGSILIDSDDLATDDGYGSDTATNASTSLAESVRDYVYENGRRYHKFREGHYNFPNDDVEQQREDMKHSMVKMLCGGQLYFAPIGNRPQHILDIGTGTGIW